MGCGVQGFGFGIWVSGFQISGQTATCFSVAARKPASSQARPRCVMAGVRLPPPCAKSTVTQVTRGPTFALRRSTLDLCLGGQRCSKSKGNRSPALRTKHDRFWQVLDLDWRLLESGDLWCKKRRLGTMMCCPSEKKALLVRLRWPCKALRWGIQTSILTDFLGNVGDSRQMLTKTRKWLQERGRDTPTKGLLSVGEMLTRIRVEEAYLCLSRVD